MRKIIKKFTLIELIIVIIILGTLVGILLPKIIGIQKDAQVASMQQDLDTIEKAADIYNTNNDSNLYPIQETQKIDKSILKKSVVYYLNLIGDDASNVYKLDEKEINPYLERTKYNLSEYYYSTKSNVAIYYNGKMDSKNNIHHILNGLINVNDLCEKTIITLTPNTTTKFVDKVIICVKAEDENGIKYIKLPDDTKIESDTTTYEVIKNGTYTFVVENNDGLKSKKSITIDNIGETHFKNLFGGLSWDGFESIEQISDGGYIVCGYSNGDGDFKTSKGGADTIIAKINKYGQMLWFNQMGGLYDDFLYSIKETPNGDFIACGTSSGKIDFRETNGEKDGLLMKFNKNGSLLWYKLDGGLKDDYYESIDLTKDGGYIVSGRTNGGGSFNSNIDMEDALVVKYDSSGNIVWNKVLGGLGNDRLKTIKQTFDGGYIACGYISSYGDNFENEKDNKDTILIKFDSNGEILWKTILGGSQEDYLYSVQETSDGGYIACGNTYGGGDFDISIGSQDAIVIKYDKNGVMEKFKMFGGYSSEYLHSIKQTSNGEYIACGATYGGYQLDNSKGMYDTFILKLDKNLNITFNKILGGSKDDELLSISETNDGGIITCGRSFGNGDFKKTKGNNDALIMKFNKEDL